MSRWCLLPERYSDALLVSRGCGCAHPIVYGIDDSGTEGKLAIGVWAIPAALRIRLGNNLP
jgi:hypothetical protein